MFCCSSVAAWGRRRLCIDRLSGDWDPSLQLFLPPHHFSDLHSAPAHQQSGGGGGRMLTLSTRLAGNKGYWTEECQARRREGEEKQTISVNPGAYGLASGSQLLSSHPANHATADTSCSGDGDRFGRLLLAVVAYLFTVPDYRKR